jgi:large subunit ribosomal protein L5
VDETPAETDVTAHVTTPTPEETEATEEEPVEGAGEESTTAEEEPEEIEAPRVEAPRVEVPRVEARRRAPTGPRSMREPKIGKVVINITTGKSGEPLDKAMTILENLTGQRPCTRRAKQTIRTFGIRKNEPISCMVTLRGERAEAVLRKAFQAVGNAINQRSFDRDGNFAFGIKEHIDIPGQRYNPSLGITGMDVMVTVEKPGYRVARRKRGRSRVGRSQRVIRDESIEFIKRHFGVEVGLPGE